MNRLFIFVLALCILASCAGSNPQSQESVQSGGFAGTWVMMLGTRTFLVLNLAESGDSLSGTLSLPERFETSNGRRYSGFGSNVTTANVVSSSKDGSTLHLVSRSGSDGKDGDRYDLSLTGPDSATLKLNDAALAPWPLTRVRDGNPRSVYTDWEPRRTYSLDDNAASNPIMQQLFEDDQAVRQDYVEFTKGASVVARGDAERRGQTRRLLAEGQLKTSEDYKRAAFIFQHGETPDDLLLAHTLAMVAASKGDADALWIASATLDRYLHATGKPQIFGTQIKERSDHTATLEPYNRQLIDDLLRSELAVQPIAVQEEELAEWTEKFKAAAK